MFKFLKALLFGESKTTQEITTESVNDTWVEETVKQMKDKGLNPEKDHFIFLTGKEYMKPLTKYIPEDNIEMPLEGKRFGQRLQWLNNQISKLHEIIKKIKTIIYEHIKGTTKRVY